MATIQQGESQSKLGKPDGIAKYSTFQDLSKHIYTTQRYGENQPIGVYNAITGDNWKIRNGHELRTYNLSAPLMTPVHMEKDYFLVPRQAILPFNWEKISKQPNIGEDVDAQEVGTSVSAPAWMSFLQKLTTDTKYNYQNYTNAQAQLLQYITKAIKLLILNEYVYSYGSLLNNLGCKMAATWKQETTVPEEARTRNFDDAFELAWSKIQYGFIITMDEGTAYTVDINLSTTVGGNKISLNEFLNIIRDDNKWNITGLYQSRTETTHTPEEAKTTMNNFMAYVTYCLNERNQYAKPVDLARLWAYQLINAEYYTNDKVDYVYSAELYREYIGNIIIDNAPGGTFETFQWNGLSYQYDHMSAHYFLDMLGGGSGVDTNICFDYAAALFSYRRSLKYLDYFTGSKTRPLGVGDVTINPDMQGNINVIDVTKNIQKQRFLNAVARIGRKAEDYAKQMFGVDMATDYHTPLWLASTRDAIRATETQNTGEAQMSEKISTTAQLEGYGGNFEINAKIDRDGVLMGISYYDIERSYARGVHRTFAHVDRYDMFNPYLQYTGDQQLWQSEYDAALAANGQDGVFGYTPAYEEFKQEYNEAQGGFVTALPGYTFIDGMEKNDAGFRPSNVHQGPDFIRCKTTELDRYFNSLSGHSYANYFHFIVDFYNEVTVTRPMSFNPSIL